MAEHESFSQSTLVRLAGHSNGFGTTASSHSKGCVEVRSISSANRSSHLLAFVCHVRSSSIS